MPGNRIFAETAPLILGRHRPRPVNLVSGSFGNSLREAKQLINLQDYDPAAEKIVEALRTDGKTADAYNLRGVLHEICGDLNGAKKSYGQAIRLDPDHEAAQQNMRRIFELFQVGCSEESIHFGDKP